MAEAMQLEPQSPWPGLASFAERDQSYFRGRELEADELGRLVRRERLTVLFGRSGLGKSSLLNAGLFPRLRDELMLPVPLRIGWGIPVPARQQVWDALATACAAAAIQAPAPRPDESLWAYFHRADAGFWNTRRRPVLPVLVFDQFEEVFTLGLADEHAQREVQGFLDELSDLVEDRPSQALRKRLDLDPALGEGIDFERRGCKVLLSFREDFLAMFEGLRARMPSIMRNRFRLLPMNAAQARAVVASGGALVDAEVGERIIGLAWRNRAQAPGADEVEQVEIDPALLSVICSELNLRRRAAGLTRIEPGLLSDAEREILSDFYERSLQGLPSAVRHFIEDELITAAGYRDSFAFDDALARPGVSRDALDGLVAHRLLRVDERFGARRLELTHDVLTRVVMDSRDRRRAREAEDALAQRERAAAATQRRNRRNGALVLTGVLAMLATAGFAAWQTMQARQAQALAAQGKAEAAVQQGIAASAQASATLEQARAASEAQFAKAALESVAIERARSRELMREAHEQALKADQLEVQARASRLLADADRLPDDQFDTALLLSLEAWRLSPTLAARGALIQRLSNPGWPAVYLPGTQLGFASLAFTPDGSRLAVQDGIDGKLRIWDVASGRLLAAGDAPGFRIFTFSPDGRQLAGATEATGEVVLWDVERKIRVATLEAPRAGQPVQRLVFSPDGRTLAAASFDTIAVWDARTLQRPQRLQAPQGSIQDLAFSPDGQRLAAAHIGSGLLVWHLDPPSREPVTLNGTVGSYCLAFSPDGRQIAWGGANAIELRDVQSGKQQVRRDEPGMSGCQVRFRADGRRVVFASESRVGVWNPQGPTHSSVAVLRGGGLRQSVTLGADGRDVAATDDRGRIALWRPDEPPARVTLPETVDKAMTAWSTVAFSPDGTRLATDGIGGVSVWDLAGSRRLVRLAGHDDWVGSMAFSPDGKRLAAAGQSSITVWSVTSPSPVQTWRDLAEAPLGNILFDPDGRLLVVSGGKSIATVGAQGLRPLAQLSNSNAYVLDVALDPRSRVLAWTSMDELGLWDSRRAAPGARIAGGSHSAVAFGANGVLAYGTDSSMNEQHKLHLWDVARSRPLVDLEGHTDTIRGLASDRSGRILASSSQDGTIRLWDLDRRESVAVVAPGYERFTGRVALSPDAGRMAIRSDSGQALVFDLDPGRLSARACKLANRNLSCEEWRRHLGAGTPYRKTCPSASEPEPACR